MTDRDAATDRAVYLNQAGTTWPKPAPVRAAVADALAADPASWGDRTARAHAAVAAAFGIADPDRLLLTPGGTSALAVAVADLPWRAGDRVVTSALEHHALARPVGMLAARGVEVVAIPPGGGAAIDLDQLEDVLRGGRVRLVACTAACNVTGDLLPFAEIGARTRRHGAWFLLDAAQVAGWLPLDVTGFDVDLLAFAGHKGLHGPWGIGGLYVAPEVTMATPGAVCALPVAGAAPCAPMPGYCDVGSVDRAGLEGLAAALDWLAQPERADRLARARQHVARLADVLRDAGAVLHGGAPGARLAIAAATVTGRTPAALAAALADRGVVAAAGLHCAPQAHATLGTADHGVLRLSTGPTHTDADLDRATAALRAVLAS